MLHDLLPALVSVAILAAAFAFGCMTDGCGLRKSREAKPHSDSVAEGRRREESASG